MQGINGNPYWEKRKPKATLSVESRFPFLFVEAEPRLCLTLLRRPFTFLRCLQGSCSWALHCHLPTKAIHLPFHQMLKGSSVLPSMCTVVTMNLCIGCRYGCTGLFWALFVLFLVCIFGLDIKPSGEALAWPRPFLHSLQMSVVLQGTSFIPGFASDSFLDAACVIPSGPQFPVL